MPTSLASTRLAEALLVALSPVLFLRSFGAFQTSLFGVSLLEGFWLGSCMRLFGSMSSECAVYCVWLISAPCLFKFSKCFPNYVLEGGAHLWLA